MEMKLFTAKIKLKNSVLVNLFKTAKIFCSCLKGFNGSTSLLLRYI